MRIVLCTLCVHCVRACVCGHTGGIQERLKAHLEGAFDECGLEFQRLVRGIVVLYTRMNHHGLFHMLVMLVEKMSIMLVMVVACCLVAGCSSRCRPRCSLCRQWHLRSAADGFKFKVRGADQELGSAKVIRECGPSYLHLPE